MAIKKEGFPFPTLNSIMITGNKKANPYEIKIYWFLISYSLTIINHFLSCFLKRPEVVALKYFEEVILIYGEE